MDKVMPFEAPPAFPKKEINKLTKEEKSGEGGPGEQEEVQKVIIISFCKQVGKLDIDADKLVNGPIMERTCTDILICFIFLVFLAGMFGTAIYGYSKGNPKLLLTAWDSDSKLL